MHLLFRIYYNFLPTCIIGLWTTNQSQIDAPFVTNHLTVPVTLKITRVLTIWNMLQLPAGTCIGLLTTNSSQIDAPFVTNHLNVPITLNTTSVLTIQNIVQFLVGIRHQFVSSLSS